MNVEKGIFGSTRYIELLLENLLFNRNNDLKNRYLQIRWNEKVDIDKKKVDIENAKISKTIRKSIKYFDNYIYWGKRHLSKFRFIGKSLNNYQELN